VTRVIFACTDSSGRSQMAAAFFNQRADARRVRAISVGMRAGECGYPGEIMEAMREVGIDVLPLPPARLTSPLAAGARHLVTMGCAEDCPFVVGVRVEDWPVEDPKGRPVEHVRRIRDEIRARVEKMIETNGWARSEEARTGTRG
jgi:arsenate reductase (thioredoxin)